MPHLEERLSAWGLLASPFDKRILMGESGDEAHMGPSPLQQPHVVPRPLGALEVRELPLFGVCAGFGVRLARAPVPASVLTS